MSKTTVVPAETTDTVETVPTVDSITSWGPFKELQQVQTQYGLYNVPRATIMTFTIEDVWNPKTGQYDRAPVPHYEKVRIDNSDQIPSVPIRSRSDEWNAENLEAYRKINDARQKSRTEEAKRQQQRRIVE